MKKGQVINIDWSVGLGLFLISTLTAVMFLNNTNMAPDQTNSLESKALEIQAQLESRTGIQAYKIPLISKGSVKVSNIPIDRTYNFKSDAYPYSGGGNIPAQLDIEKNNIVAITDSGNKTRSLVYFTEKVSNASYNNDIEVDSSWINNSLIKLRTDSTGLSSLKISDKELLKPDADLGAGDSSITESGIYAETLSGNLRVYDNSSEIIISNRTENVTFNLEGLDTVYWYENDTEKPLTGTGIKAKGETKGFTVASDYGITFLGDLEATVSKPDDSTVKVEIDAKRIRVRLHNSDYNAGKKRIRSYDKGYIVLGVSQEFFAPYSSKIKQLNSEPETSFEKYLNTEEFGYNIGFGSWLQKLVSQVSEWNQGTFNSTSAGRKSNSGDLGLGYRNGKPGDSLVGYWRMDGNSESVKDYSGNNNDGTKNGDPTHENGIFGTKSISLDGVDDTVSIPDSDKLEGFQDGLTISAWVYSRQDEKGDYSWIIQKGTFGDAPYYWADEGEGAGNIGARIEDSQNNRYSVNPGLNYREWTHVTVTYNPETGKYRGFRNGNITSEKNIGDITPLNSNTQDISLGSGGPESPWKGNIDELRIYRTSLSEEEVRKLYHYGRDGTFNGDYIIKNQTGSFQNWRELTVKTNIPSETYVDAVFESLDENGNLVDNQTINLRDGKSVYSINSDSSTGYRLKFAGSSDNPEKTWEIEDYILKYGPKLKRGSKIPLYTTAVVSDRSSTLIHRNGSFSEIQNRVVLWP